jgi:hypothetical protein
MDVTEEVPEVVGDVLTWWFGIQFWAKGEPKNPTAHYDDLWRQKYPLPFFTRP